MSFMSKDEFIETENRFITLCKRRREKTLPHDKGGTNTRIDWLQRFQTEVLIGVRRDVWENLEWKGLTTLDMGLVLQTAQNLLKPFNLNILNDSMTISVNFVTLVKNWYFNDKP